MRGSEYTDLRAFLTILEQGSFRRASAHLGIAPSSLSQRLKLLEERLGIRLINRTTRSIAATPEGSRLAARMKPLMSELDDALIEATNSSGSLGGALRINAPRIAAVHYLAPLLADFMRFHPGITVDIGVEEALVDIVSSGFDAGVRLGEVLEKDMVAVRLSGPLQMVVVASPGYLREFGYPASPYELSRHACLNYRWPSDRSEYQWEFERNGHALKVPIASSLIVDDPDVLIRVVEDGGGIAYLFASQVETLLTQGKLIGLLSEWTPPFPGFYIYHSERRLTPPPLRAFLDFLAQR